MRQSPSILVLTLGGLGVFASVAIALYAGIVLDARSPLLRRAGPEPGPVASVADESGGAQQWLSTAAERRRNHDYSGAKDAYSRVIGLNAMTADSWADYADVLASMSGGSFGADAAQAIQHALSLDPAHPKALWLEASRAYQQHRYADAVSLWKRLRAALPPDSPDGAVIDANIAESTRLASAVN